jgi:ribosomal protein L28
MSRVCEVCERGAGKGNKRSHSNIATLRRFGINLQTKKIDGERLKVCTRCIKTLSKTKK